MSDETHEEELTFLDFEIDCLYHRIHELEAELKKQKDLVEYWKMEYYAKKESEQDCFGEG